MSEPAGILIAEKKETTCIESSEVVEKLHENHCYGLKTLRDNAEIFTLKENDPNSGKPETEILINEEKEKSNEGQRYGCEHENSEKRSDEQSIGYANQGSENGYELDMGKNNPGKNSISDDEESFLSCRSNSECSYYSFDSENVGVLPDQCDLDEEDQRMSQQQGDIFGWLDGLDTDSGYQASQDGDSGGGLELVKSTFDIVGNSSSSGSTSSLREEEEFLLSGKARLRVKSLGGERPLWPTPGVRRRATVGDLEPARKTSPKPPWNYGAGGTMGRGVFQVPITPSLTRRAHLRPNI